MNKRFAFAGILLLAGWLTGCQQPNQRQASFRDKLPTFYEDINGIALSVQIPYIDEDNDHEPDGVMVDVMLNRPNEKAFVAGRGTVIFHLFQRAKSPQGQFVNTELYKWTVSEDEFAKAVVRQRFGLICHHMALYWAGVQPQGSGIYLQAEFIRIDQKRVVSRMVSIAVADQPSGNK
jgi:hypothetical protein